MRTIPPRPLPIRRPLSASFSDCSTLFDSSPDPTRRRPPRAVSPLQHVRKLRPTVIPRWEITFKPEVPFDTTGGYGDLFVGTHSRKGKVAMKRLRIGSEDDAHGRVKTFEAEAETWKNLKHPRILKFIGIYKAFGDLYMVSPFVVNGNLVDYLSRHPTAKRGRFILEMADALVYLHGAGIIHGDIKAQNALVSSSKRILLCDFGLTKHVLSKTASANQGAGSIRWQSPELWRGEQKSFASDVYAFGMTMYQVISGLLPFHSCTLDAQIIMAVAFGRERPPRLPATSPCGDNYDYLWDVAALCWVEDPLKRPSMMEAFCRLQARTSFTAAPSTVTPRSFASTAWTGPSNDGSGARVYFPSNGGIQELVCSGSGVVINGGQHWLKGAFLINPNFSVPDNASIAAANTFDHPSLRQRHIVVAVSDAENIVRTWEFHARKGEWAEGYFKAPLPRCDGHMAAVSVFDPRSACAPLSHQIFYRSESGMIQQLRKVDKHWYLTSSITVVPTGIRFSASATSLPNGVQKITVRTDEGDIYTSSTEGSRYDYMRWGGWSFISKEYDALSATGLQSLASVTLPDGSFRYFSRDCDHDLVEWRHVRLRHNDSDSAQTPWPLDITNRVEHHRPVLQRGRVYTDVLEKGDSPISIALQDHGGIPWLYVFHLNGQGQLSVCIENFLGWHPAATVRVVG